MEDTSEIKQEIMEEELGGIRIPDAASATSTDISSSDEDEPTEQEKKLLPEFTKHAREVKRLYGHPYSLRRMMRNLMIERFAPITQSKEGKHPDEYRQS